MKLMPANLGADRKKITVLVILVVAIGVSYWVNRTSDSPVAASAPGAAAAPAAIPEVGALPAAPRGKTPGPAPSNTTGSIQRAQIARSGGRDLSRGSLTTEAFNPSLKPKEGVDVTNIDPTLNLAMLAKLRDLPMQGGARSLFKEGPAPPPPGIPDVKIRPGPLVAGGDKPKSVEPDKPPAPPAPPPPPPIPLKFYGYANQTRGGQKQAFFLDGEDIRIAGENDLIRNRYKIVRIGVNSAVVEDTTDKHQQTLPLEPELV